MVFFTQNVIFYYIVVQ